MTLRLQLRRDTAANWTAANPVLLEGERGWEKDTNKWKTGDGSTPWASLAYDAGGGGGSGTVTTVSVASANGFAGTVANPTTTPALTLTTSVTGLLKGNGTAISAATPGVDYQAAGSYLTGNQTITLSGDASGSGATSITVSIPTFAGSAKGLVPASAGGTTNFLRADGSWAAAGGGAVWTECEVDFGSTPVYSKSFSIADAAVSPSSKVLVVPCGKPATGGKEDDWEWDGITLAANPGTGSFKLVTAAFPGPVAGKRKISYQVA